MRIRKKERKPRYPRQRAQEIIDLPQFQEGIMLLRKKWSIPLTGLKGQEESEKWYSWFDKLNDDFFDTDVYIQASEKLNELSKKIKNVYHHQEYEKLRKKLNNTVPVNELYNDLRELRQSLNLSDYWDPMFDWYLKFNDITLSSNTVIRTHINKHTKEKELWIRVWEHTRLEDIKNIWSQVQHFQRKIPGFKKTFRKSDEKIIERNKFILELSKEGKDTKDIVDEVYKRFVGLNFEHYSDIYNISEENVRQILSEARKKYKLK